MTLKHIKYFKRRSCKFKIKHKTMYDGLKSLLEKRKQGIAVDAVYKCIFCNFYHIGHYSKGTVRKRNRRIIRYYLKEYLDKL